MYGRFVVNPLPPPLKHRQKPFVDCVCVNFTMGEWMCFLFFTNLEIELMKENPKDTSKVRKACVFTSFSFIWDQTIQFSDFGVSNVLVFQCQVSLTLIFGLSDLK